MCQIEALQLDPLNVVARLDPKLDRKTRTLHINGFWLARRVDIELIIPKKLQKHIRKYITSRAGL